MKDNNREMELRNELEELERREFYLEMKDNWNANDYKRYDELHERQREIKKELEILEDGRD